MIRTPSGRLPIDVKNVPLSVLELAPVTAGRDPAEALGLHDRGRPATPSSGATAASGSPRHHNMPAIASSTPAVLIAHLAAVHVDDSGRFRRGDAAEPRPARVAEQFGTLASLHPGRIDLGVGRAPGTDQRTALSLRRTPDGLSAENFPSEFADVVRMLPAATTERLASVPTPTSCPKSGACSAPAAFSAQLAGQLGLPFSFAHHFFGGEHEPNPRSPCTAQSFSAVACGPADGWARAGTPLMEMDVSNAHVPARHQDYR